MKNNNFDKIVQTISSIPVWMLKDDIINIHDCEDLIITAARKSFLFKRYQDVLKQEDLYWGQVAYEMLFRETFPRQTDSRRHISQYDNAGKKSWIDLYRILFHKQIRKLILKIKDLPGPILELGCGCGWLSLEIARLGKNVDAFDASEKSLSIARFFYEYRDFGIEYLPDKFCGFSIKSLEKQGSIQYKTQDLNNLELPKEKYSAVVVWESLHHIHNIAGLVEQVRYTLKPGGVFIVHETLNEHLNGLRLQRYLTRPKVLNILSRLHKNYTKTDSSAPTNNQTNKQSINQSELFSIFKKAFPDAYGGEESLCSPFEGVSREDMINEFKKHFNISYKSLHHHHLTEAGGFNTVMNWTDHLGFAPRRSIVKTVFRGFKKLDALLLKLIRITPRHGFFIMTPKKGRIKRTSLTIKMMAEQLNNKPINNQEWQILIKKAYARIKKTPGAGIRANEVLDIYSLTEVFNGRLAPAEDLSSLLLISGWYLEEEDFRWTNGSSKFYYCFPEDSKKIVLVVLGSPVVSKDNPQGVKLLVDDKLLSEFQISVQGWQRYELKLDNVPRKVVKLSIKSENFVPKESFDSDDTRVLGIAVKYLEAKI